MFLEHPDLVTLKTGDWLLKIENERADWVCTDHADA